MGLLGPFAELRRRTVSLWGPISAPLCSLIHPFVCSGNIHWVPVMSQAWTGPWGGSDEHGPGSLPRGGGSEWARWRSETESVWLQACSLSGSLYLCILGAHAASLPVPPRTQASGKMVIFQNFPIRRLVLSSPCSLPGGGCSPAGEH